MPQQTHSTFEHATYDLQVSDAISEIRKAEAKMVLVQLPDGLKPFADAIRSEILKELPEVELVFWADSCYGACDAPLHVRHLGFDLLLAFGHAPWRS